MKSFVVLIASFCFINVAYAQSPMNDLAHGVSHLVNQHIQDLSRSDERKVKLHLEEVTQIFQEYGFSVALGESSVSPCYFIVNNNNVLKKIHNEAGTTIERRENEKTLFFLERAVKTGVCRLDTSETDCRQKETVGNHYSEYCSPRGYTESIVLHVDDIVVSFFQNHRVCHYPNLGRTDTLGQRNHKEKAQSAFERLKALCPQIRKD